MLRILRPTATNASIRLFRFYTTTTGGNNVTPSIKKEPLSPLGRHLHDSIKVEKE
jgi:hypothetical protein